MELQERIKNACEEVTEEMCRKACCSVMHRFRDCLNKLTLVISEFRVTDHCSSILNHSIVVMKFMNYLNNNVVQLISPTLQHQSFDKQCAWIGAKFRYNH